MKKKSKREGANFVGDHQDLTNCYQPKRFITNFSINGYKILE